MWCAIVCPNPPCILLAAFCASLSRFNRLARITTISEVLHFSLHPIFGPKKYYCSNKSTRCLGSSVITAGKATFLVDHRVVKLTGGTFARKVLTGSGATTFSPNEPFSKDFTGRKTFTSGGATGH